VTLAWNLDEVTEGEQSPVNMKDRAQWVDWKIKLFKPFDNPEAMKMREAVREKVREKFKRKGKTIISNWSNEMKLINVIASSAWDSKIEEYKSKAKIEVEVFKSKDFPEQQLQLELKMREEQAALENPTPEKNPPQNEAPPSADIKGEELEDENADEVEIVGGKKKKKKKSKTKKKEEKKKGEERRTSVSLVPPSDIAVPSTDARPSSRNGTSTTDEAASSQKDEKQLAFEKLVREQEFAAKKQAAEVRLRFEAKLQYLNMEQMMLEDEMSRVLKNTQEMVTSKRWFPATITGYNPETGLHRISFDKYQKKTKEQTPEEEIEGKDDTKVDDIPWIEFSTEDGVPYYYNSITGETSWIKPELPPVEEPRQESPAVEQQVISKESINAEQPATSKLEDKNLEQTSGIVSVTEEDNLDAKEKQDKENNQVQEVMYL
jgi:hypothetical protein